MMKIVGVVAEFNPFHNGHSYFLNTVREQGADIIVCAMSGNYVQRGDVAICNKFTRSYMAVCEGVDLVLEIPTPWAMAGAETFALGGVEILTKAGCTHIAFGTECDSLEDLIAIKDCLLTERADQLILKNLQKGITYAVARLKAVTTILGENKAFLLKEPNNILAVEYLKAIDTLHSPLIPENIKRKGASHDGTPVGDIASASYLREHSHYIQPYVSEKIYQTWIIEMSCLRAPATMYTNERGILSALRSMSEEELKPYDIGNEGLYHRFYDALRNNPNLERVLQATKTKRYPLSRLRRMALCAYLKMEQPSGTIPYIRVLAMDAKGQSILRQMQDKDLPVLTKPADVGALGEEAKALFEKEVHWTDLYILCYPYLETSPGVEWRSTPYVTRDLK